MILVAAVGGQRILFAFITVSGPLIAQFITNASNCHGLINYQTCFHYGLYRKLTAVSR